MRRLLGRLALVLGGLLLGVIAAEIFSRLVRPDASADLLFGSPESSPMGLYVIDHQTLLTPRPGFSGAIPLITAAVSRSSLRFARYTCC